MCESLWVLRRLYRASRHDLSLLVETLLDDDVFVVEDAQEVQEALARFREGKADFADYLIGVDSRLQGASTTFTFDSALREESGFTWLDAKPRPAE